MIDYNNTYGYNSYPSFTQPRTNVYAFVNGIEGAKSYQMMPNQTVLLMDSDNPICYMKTSNSIGQSTLRFFKLLETTEQDLMKIPEDSPLGVLTKRVDELYKIINKEDKENA